jgi:uncharacterized protein YraI
VAVGRKDTLRAGRFAALTLAAALSALPGIAQDIRTEQVRFGAGQTGTTIAGRITGYESVSYTLGAEAGQRMRVALDPSNLAAYFNVYAPGAGPGDDALANGGLPGPMVPDLNRFEGTLPASGTYTVSVYMMRAAARRNEVSDYTLAISITGATGEIVQGDFADGLQGGPDFFEVRTARGGTLNLRSAPSGGAAVVTRLAYGTTVRNLGCRMAEAQRWCSVATLSDPGIEGWAAGDFLVEGSGETATQLPDMIPVGPGAVTPSAAEQACLAAISRETQNGDVVLLGSDFSEAGTVVRVGVGPDRAPWQCIAYADGTTGGIMFLSEDAMVPGTDYHATGPIHCSPEPGAAETTCNFGVHREGAGNGRVDVTLPDGRGRAIFYSAGVPIYFDRSEADGDIAFEATRRGDEYLVRIGPSSFVLPDAVIWGG